MFDLMAPLRLWETKSHQNGQSAIWEGTIYCHNILSLFSFANSSTPYPGQSWFGSVGHGFELAWLRGLRACSNSTAVQDTCQISYAVFGPLLLGGQKVFYRSVCARSGPANISSNSFLADYVRSFILTFSSWVFHLPMLCLSLDDFIFNRFPRLVFRCVSFFGIYPGQ